ncbi:hypothetical protein F2P81_003854 [Scophthalmus maximus]|uniref:Integrase zinc-binding domain-containing protein n=1 Tax=Scophthalmus maximus TaxID=52904 RepID=A0A6A4TAS5_SCOMX|nr:hypothetical protein F2P81_003854 [Scophthalmus maximus]
MFYPQILPPHAYCASVMKQMHEGPVGSHFGVERSLTRLKTRHFWYNMKDDDNLWGRTCTSCAAKARPKEKTQTAMGRVKVGIPMERIAVELIGPLNENERHNRFNLVVSDYFRVGRFTIHRLQQSIGIDSLHVRHEQQQLQGGCTGQTC